MEVFRLPPALMAVARHLAEGHANKEIAIRLGLAENTIKAYVQIIMRQTRFDSRLKIALAFRDGRFVDSLPSK